MKHTQYTHIEENEFPTFLSADVELSGVVKARDAMLVKGAVHESDIQGTLVYVATGGSVQGKIRASHLMVLGSVSGKVLSTENLHVLKNGSVKGEVEVENLIIDRGAQLNSVCKMIPPSERAAAAE